MPIETQCQKCGRKFRLPDKYAGKRAKCPKCQGTIEIPAAGESSSGVPAPEERTAAKQAEPEKPAPERWFLQTEDGRQYGPASREELNDWVAQGRVDASCQLLREGWPQWKWADEVYPELAEAPAQPQQPPMAADQDPFAGIGQSAQPSRREVNPYASPREPAGGTDIMVESGESGAITPGTRNALAQTRPWVIFLSILGFIFGGLMVLVALAMVVAGIVDGAGARGFGPGPGELLIFVGLSATYFILSAVWLAPSYYLLRYGQQIGRFLRSRGPGELEGAMAAQKSFWRLVGILAILLLALYAVMIMIMVLAGIAT